MPAGLGVLAALGHPLRHRLGLAYMAGVSAVGVILTLLLIAGASLARWQFLLVCAVLSLPALRGGLPRPRLRLARPSGPAVAIGVLLVLAFLALLGLDLAHQPLWESDAWSDWTAKAKAIVVFGGLDPTYMRNAINESYPLLVPALEAVDFRFMGLDTVAVHLQFWCLAAGFVAALYDLLRDRVRPVVLWSVLPTLVLAPALAIQSAYGIADVPLGCFVGLAGVAAMRWLQDGNGPDLALVALLAAAAVATKSEGVLYTGAIGVVLLALALRRSRRAAAAVGLAAFAALVGIVPWTIWAGSHGLGNWFTRARDVGGPVVKPHIGRAFVAAPYVAREILDPTSWLLIGPVAIAAVVLAWRAGSRTEALLAIVPPLIVYAGFVWIYWHTPYDLHRHLSNSARRVIVALDLYLIALTPLLVEAALSRLPVRTTPPP